MTIWPSLSHLFILQCCGMLLWSWGITDACCKQHAAVVHFRYSFPLLCVSDMEAVVSGELCVRIVFAHYILKLKLELDSQGVKLMQPTTDKWMFAGASLLTQQPQQSLWVCKIRPSLTQSNSQSKQTETFQTLNLPFASIRNRTV